MTNNAQGPPAEVTDSIWGLVASGLAAFAGWAALHWADIGLGGVAIALTLVGTWATKPPIEWVLKRKPVQDDTRNLIIRGVAMVWACIAAASLGFSEHFGRAIGITFDPYAGLGIGTVLNAGAAFGVFHGRKFFGAWVMSDSPSAQAVRRVGRVWFYRLARVSKEEADTQKTAKQSPQQMAELYQKLAEDDEE